MSCSFLFQSPFFFPLPLRSRAQLSLSNRVLQKLIRTHPFSTWPLHVKLFTEEAVQCWDALSCALPLFSSSVHRDTSSGNVAVRKQDLHQYTSLFPPGFTYSIELEGVDGSSGLPGSGRRGPISVTDGELLFIVPFFCYFGFWLPVFWSMVNCYSPIIRPISWGGDMQSVAYTLSRALPWVRVDPNSFFFLITTSSF